ncbi:MAG: MarR family transcriptional regulator [Clostridia bacterium]|nr:MarR family transcriptional regulator [Clostridia bacterium]
MKEKSFGTPSRELLSTRPPMLINEISRLFFDRMRATDPPGVLSQHGCRLVLMALIRAREKEGRTWLSQRELATVTHLKAPTVSVILREMEDDGLVVRLAHERDARTTCVQISDKGLAAHEEIGLRLRALDEELMRGFDENERRALGEMLLRVRDNILQSEEEKV